MELRHKAIAADGQTSHRAFLNRGGRAVGDNRSGLICYDRIMTGTGKGGKAEDDAGKHGIRTMRREQGQE